MPAGLHGHNGLNPATCVHLLYVSPILTYGLEIILPKKKHIDKLDTFFKKLFSYYLEATFISSYTNCWPCAIYSYRTIAHWESDTHKSFEFFQQHLSATRWNCRETISKASNRS